MLTKEALSGLDFAPIKNWHQSNYTRIKFIELINNPRILRSSTNCVSQIEILGLTDSDWINRSWLQNVFDRFPAMAIERILAILGKIELEDTAWFHRDSIVGKPILTKIANEAISPTSLIPAGFWTEKRDDRVALNIFISRLPSDFTIKNIEAILIRQALIHELCHCLVNTAWTLTTPKLLIGKEVIDGEEVIIRFIRLMRGICPISRYSASYWQSHVFYNDDPNRLKDGTLLLHIEEEIVEAITAALLGHVFCKKGSTNTHFKPFKDRPEILKWVEDFLNAQWVKGDSQIKP